MIEHVQKSIANAEAGVSKMSAEAFQVPAMASPKIRHLLNNLGSAPALHYLEIGVHKGGTFVATNYKNQLASSVAVDNWCEFSQDGLSKAEFYDWTTRLLTPGKFVAHEKDCFAITKGELPNPVNFYLYDGGHSLEAQYKALTHFYDMLDDTFIFLVDDYNWRDVQEGTQESIKDLNLKVLFEKVYLTEPGTEIATWWNGFYISVLQK